MGESARRLARGGREVLKATLGGLAMAAAAGATYQFLASWNTRRRYRPPGRLVDIGGHSLHARDMGEGSPAVVLEAGLTATSAAWGWVQPALAEVTRVISYDRMGIGWSDESPEPHDGITAARHLAALLDRLAVEGPLVLVGHSMGALYVRVFADLFRDRVAGLVLVDPAHPDQLQRFSTQGVRLQRNWMGQLRVAPVLAGLGVLRLTGGMKDEAVAELPKDSRLDVEIFYSSLHHLRGVKEEMLAWDEVADQARRARPLGDLPLVVLSASDLPPELLPSFHLLHEELAGRSRRGMHRIIEGSNHRTILTDRANARVTTAAILEIVEAVRSAEARQSA